MRWSKEWVPETQQSPSQITPSQTPGLFIVSLLFYRRLVAQHSTVWQHSSAVTGVNRDPPISPHKVPPRTFLSTARNARSWEEPLSVTAFGSGWYKPDAI